MKTAADLDTSMESVMSENLNLIPMAVKGFRVLSEESCLPEPKGVYTQSLHSFPSLECCLCNYI